MKIDNQYLIVRRKNENMSNFEIARLLRNDPKTIHNEFNPGTTLQQARKGWDKNIDSIV